MKTIILLRHAKSSWDEHWLPDMDRPLSERGKNNAPRMAQLLASHYAAIDLILCSPAKRTRETVVHFAEVFEKNFDTEITYVENIYEAHASELYEILRTLPQEANSVMIVGHNPSLTNFTNRFEGPFFDNIPTCGIVVLESKIENWADFDDKNTHVAHFYFPKIHLK
jgi:phosphohistidine phosphatase